MRNTKMFTLESCKKCNRKSSCDNTCNDAYNEFNASNPQFTPIHMETEDSDNDIENFLDFEVTDIEWLRVCNKQMSIFDILDKNAIREYLVEQNRLYCEREGLCKHCRNPLKEYTEYEDGIISERYWTCQYGCE